MSATTIAISEARVLALGGVEATIMRLQLIRPHNALVSPQVFNRMFTMHVLASIVYLSPAFCLLMLEK